ncbi:phosphoserine phosphatase SerB [Pseudoalteromonas mariniglutinosa]|uniref:phosphoserine phosphatase SerB n=1 Tax=Pseudoalteromonas mariniglutinosa TaxID=206042 RepID=UPI00384F8436
MLQLSLAGTHSANLANHMQLQNWYRIEDQQLVATDFQPVATQGLFSVAFAGDLDGVKLKQLIDFLANHGVICDYICCYQPDMQLAAGWCLYSQHATKLCPLLLQAFAAQQGYQLVQVKTPPVLSEPGLLLMDMDSTAITIECIDEIARLANVYDEVAAVTAQAMAGQLDFSESLKQRVKKLAGIELSLIDELKMRLPLMPGVSELCQVLKQHNWHLAIASGGFVPFAEQVQQLLQLDEVHANQLAVQGSQLTGEVTGMIVDAQQKATILTEIKTRLALSEQQTVAMGDGANDLTMMANAGLGIAVHGKPKVVEHADAAITQGSLLQVLYLLTIPVARG